MRVLMSQPRELEPVPQRRAHPVRTGRHALRDRRRRPRQLELAGPVREPPREDPADDADGDRARRTTRSRAAAIFAFGIRNSFGFTFDPQTGSLWETENGPECNDEINLIVGGGNFGWGPSETAAGRSPGNTNNSGPTPRRSRSSGSSGRSGSPAMRSATAAAWEPGRRATVLRRREHRRAASGRAERRPGRRVGRRDRRPGRPGGRDLLDGNGAERADLLQRRRRPSTGSLPREARQTLGNMPERHWRRPFRRSTLAVVAGGTAQPARRPAVDIGQPKRIIEVEPASLPLPETLPTRSRSRRRRPSPPSPLRNAP